MISLGWVKQLNISAINNMICLPRWLFYIYFQDRVLEDLMGLSLHIRFFFHVIQTFASITIFQILQFHFEDMVW